MPPISWSDVLCSVNTRSGALDQAIEQLIKAPRTGKPAHVQGATDAIERALCEWRLLQPAGYPTPLPVHGLLSDDSRAQVR
jgi:hypothetical protein